MNTTVIIQGSSRSHGDTSRIVNFLASQTGIDIIDLKVKNIGHYDYEYHNTDDDFFPLISSIIESYDTIIFATPVYWYTMSGHLKVFFDRLSDLIRIHKDLGRQLRGKKMAMVSCSNGKDIVAHFNMPFVESANYLGMEYLGDIHTWVENDVISEEVKQIVNEFSKDILK